MADKRSLVVYYDILEQLEDFNDEQVGKIFRAMVEYDKNGTIPNFTGEMKIAFKFIKLSLDKNKEDYLAKCAKNSESARKRWEKDNANGCERIPTDANDADNDTDNDTDNDIDNDLKKKKEIKKENKHKYGKFGWFLLTDAQIEKLYKDFGKDYINQVIDILDEQIQSTGNKNKYKDWNLVIRKAIRDKWSCLKGIKQVSQPQKNNDYVNVDISYIGKYGETVFDVYQRKKGQTEWTEEDKERILKEKGGKRWIY